MLTWRNDQTIAEMIETAEQARWLARAQVTHGQGYLFGRPSAALPGGSSGEV